MSTESELKLWRYGTTQAERMCSDLLALLDFEGIDPQAPLGGGDDIKDILCTKAGIKYVAAAYFPTTSKNYSDVEKKFVDDLQGVKKNGRDGFLFFTNQHLTIGDRDKLLKLSKPDARDCQVFHLERLRTILDQPSGYGIRMQYLRIELTAEEQFAYFANARARNDRTLEQQQRLLSAVNAKLDKLLISQDYISQTMAVVASDMDLGVVPPPTRPELFLGGTYKVSINDEPFSPKLNRVSVLALHRAICFDMPQNSVGLLRDSQVYLAAAGKPLSQAAVVPPTASEVPALLDKLVADWSSGFQDLSVRSREDKLRAIATFHAEFLRIHPFLDGNGRVARFILMQHCLDLFGVADMGVFDKGIEYYAALQNADQGDLLYLVDLIKPVVGIETETA